MILKKGNNKNLTRPKTKQINPQKLGTKPENKEPSSKSHFSSERSSKKQNQEWLFGIHACKYALLNPKREILKVILTSDLFEHFMQQDVPVDQYKHELKSSLEIAKHLPLNAVHQNIAVLTKPLPQVYIEDLLALQKDSSCVLLLDQVTDPHNIGAIMRSASAFGADAIIVPERNSPNLTATLSKSASGATEFLPFIRVSNLVRTIDQLKKHGYWVIGLDETGKKSLEDISLKGKIAFIMGAEGAGMRRLSLESCDFLAHLPTQPPIGCLNVSNAAAISLYEYRRQNK